MFVKPKITGLGDMSSIKYIDLMVTEVQSNVVITCLSNPNKHEPCMFTGSKTSARSKIHELGNQPSSHDMGMTYLPNPRHLDLVHI